MNRILTYLAQISGGDIGLPQGQLTSDDTQMARRIAFGVAGAIALLMITISAFKYVVSQGDSQSVAKAKNALISSIIGLVIVIFAYAIVEFVITKL